MDSHLAQGFTFDVGLSLQVTCEDQAEVDRYWDALGAGGEHGPCGWLKDRFGLSWQVVPSAMTEWMTGADQAARDRVFRAMLPMKKLDLAALRRAHDGG
jgi:predicted 3-demethylubiquinone-9 3-methyltransferase (glyoxalase superfamily)